MKKQFLKIVLWSFPFFSMANPTEFGTKKELADYLDKHYSHIEVTLGFGSKQQYGNVEDVIQEANRVIAENNAKFGIGKWSVLYGGDGANPEKPDVGWLAKYYSDNGVPVFAAQQRIVKEQWGGVPAWIKGVLYDGPEGLKASEVKWGGTENVQTPNGEMLMPVGNTDVYLGETLRATLGSKLRVRALGGGDIALAEARYAQAKGVSVDYHPVRARFLKDGSTPVNPSEASSYGPLHPYFASSEFFKNDNIDTSGASPGNCGKSLTD